MKLFKRVCVGFAAVVLSASWAWATSSSQIKLSLRAKECKARGE
ncbi:hypothetical protein ACR9PT_11605 [Piscirickettsia salmonis]